MLSKLRIGPKLLLAPAAVLFLLVLVASGAYYAMLRQNDSLTTIAEQRATRLRDTAALVQSAQRAHADVYQLLAWLGASFAEPRVAQLQRVIALDQAATSRRLEMLIEDTRASATEQRLLQQARLAHGAYLKTVADVLELARADTSTSAAAMSKAERAFDIVAARLADLSAHEQGLSELAARRAAADFSTMSTLLPLAVLLSVALSLAITMAVRRALLREVTDIGEAAIDLASGNLLVPQRDYGADEISATSRVLDTSIRNLNATLKGIMDAARSIDSASRQVTVGSADLSQRTVAQASTLQHTAGAVEGLSAVLSQTASNAQAARQLTIDASHAARGGSDTVGRLLGTMGALRGDARQVSVLAERIDTIASQAGRLALNAAVEAGRGELVSADGSAFAAIALEVRALAQQSALAARDIGALMEHAVADIDGGSASASAAGDSIAHMARQVDQVGDIISAISHASVAQASGMLEVSEAIVHMDQMTQQNSALVSEAARAAADLQRQAVGLARAVAGFNLDEAALLSMPARHVGGSGKKAHLRLASSRL